MTKSTTLSQPSYYAIIPANVRYCKDLEPNAKLLYGEITALCSKEGYCWATNRYLASLFDCGLRSIQYWLASLQKNNFIVIEHESDEFNPQRRIYLRESFQEMSTVRQNFHGTLQKMSAPPEKNGIHSNTYSTTSKNSSSSSPPKEPEEKSLRSESKSLRSEEEDSSSLKILAATTLSPAEKKRLSREYSPEQISQALKIASTQPIKKSLIALLLTILKDPSRWESALEPKQKSPAHQKALHYNRELITLSPELAKRNEALIEKDIILVDSNYGPQQLSIKSDYFEDDINAAIKYVHYKLKHQKKGDV